MIASDPLSYIFLGCFLFSAVFLVITTLFGVGHGHALGAGGHSLHLPHIAGGHHITGGHHIAGHVTAGGHAPATAHGATHAAASSTSHVAGADTAGTTLVSPLDGLRSLLLGTLNLYGLLTLLLLFGLLGYLLHNFTNLGAELSLILALLVGAGGALLVSSLLSSLFFNREVGVLGAESSVLEGRLGKTSIAIRSGGIGEVIYTTAQGGRHSMGARSADGEAIPVNTDIVILGTKNGIASVQPWDRFMSNVRAGLTPSLEPIDTD
jgi:hypothetical protein